MSSPSRCSPGSRGGVRDASSRRSGERERRGERGERAPKRIARSRPLLRPGCHGWAFLDADFDQVSPEHQNSARPRSAKTSRGALVPLSLSLLLRLCHRSAPAPTLTHLPAPNPETTTNPPSTTDHALCGGGLLNSFFRGRLALSSSERAQEREGARARRPSPSLARASRGGGGSSGPGFLSSP